MHLIPGAVFSFAVVYAAIRWQYRDLSGIQVEEHHEVSGKFVFSSRH